MPAVQVSSARDDLQLSPLTEHVETEPNDKKETLTTVALKAMFFGKININISFRIIICLDIWNHFQNKKQAFSEIVLKEILQIADSESSQPFKSFQPI